MGELLARLRAALRRGTGGTADTPQIANDAFTVDLAAKRVTTAAGETQLPPTEWHLLELLVRHPDQLCTHRQRLAQVWGPASQTETNYLRVQMADLRRKLEPDPTHPRYLITEPGIGYRQVPWVLDLGSPW